MLLDTDVVVDILRGYPPALAWLDALAEDELILLPGFAVMEVIHGCQNKQEQRRVENFLDSFDVVWPRRTTCAQALDTFASNHLRHSVGILDALIGHTAIDLGLPLASFNQKHYTPIAGLRLEQPYLKSV